MANENKVGFEEQPKKIINDPIHGSLCFPPLYFRIIDTPQFQRLRYLKQLGSCYYVYPGATHTRFEHSLGVCYLAEKMVRNLKQKHPDLIDEKDVLCVSIAGLCHDLGHGPISHTWEVFVKEAQPNKKKWEHESTSVDMVDHIFTKELQEEFKLDPDDVTFIKELIQPLEKISEEWPYKGRNKDKSFLYEIVANKRNGIDVDKWDYFLRDCHYLGFKDIFDYEHVLQFIRVIEDKATGLRHICFRDKEEFNLYQMFNTRGLLHRRAYKHRVVRIIDAMLLDVFLLVDDIIKIPSKNGDLLSLSECHKDMEAFTKLNDFIVHRILLESEPVFMKNNKSLTKEQKQKLTKARKIIERIEERKLYSLVGSQPLPEKNNISKVNLKREAEKISKKQNDLRIDVMKINYGRAAADPIKEVKFYGKRNVNEICKTKEELLSKMLPSCFQEETLYGITSASEDDRVEHLKKRFKKWCGDNIKDAN